MKEMKRRGKKINEGSIKQTRKGRKGDIGREIMRWKKTRGK